MRLFVALAPPPGPLGELDRVVAPLRADWPALRWVGQERWHVTLAFLGEVAPDKLAGLGERLARAAGRHPSLSLRIGAAGAFPSAARARVFCAHITAGTQDLAGLRALAASVAAGARRAGAPPPDEGRRYRPHLTLARSREPSDLRALVQALAGFAGSTWMTSQIHLVCSQTGPATHYETIGTWPLRLPRPAPQPRPQPQARP
ncbi:MAG TPA: RNA 2',3'-cyclic phosphodiesterase [Streptosporangiaceae bacterium]|nr:RNA 2',3'-cyclic phosphodiesterase [Streptosporangiaceae bacterium]